MTSRPTGAPDDQLERVLADAWPPRVVRRRGPWLLRAADGFTKRANSAAVLGRVDERRALELLAAAEHFARDHAIPPRAQAARTDRTAPVRRVLVRRGWTVESSAGVWTVDLTSAEGVGADGAARERPAADVRVAPAPGRRWLSTWLEVVGGGRADRAHGGALLDRMSRAVHVGVPDPAGGPDLAVGLGVLRGDVLAVFGMGTRASARRRGLARRLLAALHAHGVAHGARTAALTVTADNGPAARLYSSVGYAHRHDTDFWRLHVPRMHGHA